MDVHHIEGFPVIDLASFRQGGGAEQTIAQWKQAFTTLGFAIVTGHGVDLSLLEEVYSISDQFFSLPMEQKLAYCLKKGYGIGGYCPPGFEQVSSSLTTPDGGNHPEKFVRPPDAVENMLIHHCEKDIIPSSPANYKAVMYRYWDQLVDLLKLAMRLTAVSLSLHEDFFQESFVNPSCVLRLAHYPIQDKPDHPDQLRYGEHTDYTGYTFLSTNAPGLQVLFPNGEWKDCPVVKNSFIVNAGDLIQVWTNDVFRSNRHRVIMPDEVYAKGKTSIVFFTGPDDETLIECLPSCQTPERPPKYQAIKSGDHLARKIKAGNSTI